MSRADVPSCADVLQHNLSHDLTGNRIAVDRAVEFSVWLLAVLLSEIG